MICLQNPNRKGFEQSRRSVTGLVNHGTRLYFLFKFHVRRGADKLCRDVHRLLPWCSQTFAVAFLNFCRGVRKLLLWRFQTFAVEFANFCRGVFKLLLVVFANFCCDVHKLLPWCSLTFAVALTIFFRVYQIVFRQFQNKVSYLKLEGLS